MILDWKNQYCQNDYTTQGNLQIKRNLYQIASGIFHKQEYILKNKKSFIEYKRPWVAKAIMRGKKITNRWRNKAPWIQTILQSCSHQDSMLLAQK